MADNRQTINVTLTSIPTHEDQIGGQSWKSCSDVRGNHTNFEMTVESFVMSDLVDKIDQTMKYGSQIGARFLDDYEVSLYAMPGFFVEIFEKPGFEITKIEVHTNHHVLIDYSASLAN